MGISDPFYPLPIPISGKGEPKQTPAQTRNAWIDPGRRRKGQKGRSAGRPVGISDAAVSPD